eukprot:gnl/TRDRNA2_/TRDRNA2_84498_c0_seq1.p1 gnl/TRDRNA2_/TRDRNA2_84498_c0~~gnl/TRDRNA2_/TRDRNA2_84498_c0_seq1.p1  ORF type:complete len:145 (-),score=48.68 gnl/TRDRNA2_/TRDRNA2_84498_c0_seq1:65-499(-)
MAPVQFKVPGLAGFELDVDSTMKVSQVKKLASEKCTIEPEHMRFICNDRLLKDMDVMEVADDATVQVFFTAGHTGLMGGSKPTLDPNQNPFQLPVRGLPGSTGNRESRVSHRKGGMGLIRKYGILMKRQEFREKAQEMGWNKYL